MNSKPDCIHPMMGSIRHGPQGGHGTQMPGPSGLGVHTSPGQQENSSPKHDCPKCLQNGHRSYTTMSLR
jgi:hypothetical protein